MLNLKTATLKSWIMGNKLNVLFEEASVNYNNVMAMLPLAIEDIKTRLPFGRGQQRK